MTPLQLKRLMSSAGIERSQLAAMLKITPDAVSKLRSGKNKITPSREDQIKRAVQEWRKMKEVKS